MVATIAVDRTLRWVAVATTVVIALALLPGTLADSGSATVYLLGVPLLAAAAVLVADLTGRAVGVMTAVTAVAALVVLVWGLLLGLGYGVYFLLPGLLLLVAVLAAQRRR